MREIFLVMVFLPIVVFAQMQNPEIRRGPMRQRMKEPSPELLSFTEMMLVQYLDLRKVQKEYIQKVKYISDQTRLQSQRFLQQLAAYEKHFFELASRDQLMYQDQQKMLDVLEEMTRINRQLFALQKRAMKQIEELNIQREKEIMEAMESWLKRARRNPDELMNFVKFLEKARIKNPSLPSTENE